MLSELPKSKNPTEIIPFVKKAICCYKDMYNLGKKKKAAVGFLYFSVYLPWKIITINDHIYNWCCFLCLFQFKKNAYKLFECINNFQWYCHRVYVKWKLSTLFKFFLKYILWQVHTFLWRNLGWFCCCNLWISVGCREWKG